MTGSDQPRPHHGKSNVIGQHPRSHQARSTDGDDNGRAASKDKKPFHRLVASRDTLQAIAPRPSIARCPPPNAIGMKGQQFGGQGYGHVSVARRFDSVDGQPSLRGSCCNNASSRRATTSDVGALIKRVPSPQQSPRCCASDQKADPAGETGQADRFQPASTRVMQPANPVSHKPAARPAIAAACHPVRDHAHDSRRSVADSGWQISAGAMGTS